MVTNTQTNQQHVRVEEKLVLPEILFNSRQLTQNSFRTSTPQPGTVKDENELELPTLSHGHFTTEDSDDSLTQEIDLPIMTSNDVVDENENQDETKDIERQNDTTSEEGKILPKIKQNFRTPKSSRQSPVQSDKKTTEMTLLQLEEKHGKRMANFMMKRKLNLESSKRSCRMPDTNIPALLKRELTMDIMKRTDVDKPIPLSSTDRKINTVRHTMYGNVLRKSTKKLQDDLRHTMRAYSTEKYQLLRQLADLRHEMDELKTTERNTSPSSSTSSSTKSSSRSNSRYFAAPNNAARKIQKKGGKKERINLMEPKLDNKDMGNSFRSPRNSNKVNVAKLPVIPSSVMPTIRSSSPADKRGPEWSSGNITYNNLPPVIPHKGIAAAKALLENSYQIPKISDPQREDISIASNTLRSTRSEKKKVHFSEVNKIKEFESVVYNTTHSDEEDNISFQRNKKVRGSKKRERGQPLAPIKRPNDPKEAQKVAAEYKALYLSIQDPIIRTRTLADILYAVRMRMQENENHMNLKVTDMPKPAKADNSLCNFLLKQPRETTTKETQLPPLDTAKTRKQFIGAPNNTAARVGRKSTSNQLQSYLRKMSKSRRMIEHMEAEQYRMVNVIGNKPLQDASEQMQATSVA